MIANILTIDVEDWFHICGLRRLLPEKRWPELESRVMQNTCRILEILERHRTRATFFVLGYVADTCPELVRLIASKGHEIASHGYSHRRVYTMTPRQFEDDLRRSVATIAQAAGVRVRGFRAPEWSIRKDSLWALAILTKLGFTYDSSMAPLPLIGSPDLPTSPYRIAGLAEFPPLVRKTALANLPLAGGWGLRVFPYPLIKRTIAGFNRRQIPATVYFHPNEFDPQPIRPDRLPPAKRFVLQASLVPAPVRLQRLLEDFHFGPVATVMAAGQAPS